MKRMIALVAALAAVTTMVGFARAADLDYIALLKPGAVVIHADIIENPHAPRNGRTILFVHGLAHTGNAFRPLVGQIFTDPAYSKSVRRAILVNMPGRGGSSLPYGTHFGDLDVSDYATVVIRTLEVCGIENIQPTEVVAHSMGGLVIQVAQERLLARRTSLNRAFGVNRVRLIGSSTPGEVQDPFLESGAGLYLLSLYTANSPVLGQYVHVDAPTWLGLFFTDLAGNLVPNAPTPRQVVAFGYKSDEPFAVALQTVGTADLRPSVRTNAFAPANGTNLRVIVGSQDPFSDLTVQKSLYEYLTGDLGDVRFDIITASDAVHDQFIVDPAAVVPALDL